MNEKNLQTITMEEIWKSQSDGYLPCLLEIYNPDIKWTDNSLEQENCYLRVISDTNSVVYKGKRYLPSRFNFQMPEENGKQIGSANLSISTIDARVIQILRSIDIPCEITIKAFFAKKGSVIKFNPLDSITMIAPSVTYNRLSAQFNLVFKDTLSINVPAEIATKDKLHSVLEK